MNFAMDQDVLELVATVADFFARRDDAAAIAEAATTASPADRARWSALCDMGLPALCVPEPSGIGAGLLEATALAENLGAVLVPEPAAESIVLAGALHADGNHPETLAAVCAGTKVVAFCGSDTMRMSSAGAVSGRARVPDDALTDAVAFIARDPSTADQALVIVETEALSEPVDRSALDPTRRIATVDLDRVQPSGVVRLDDAAAEGLRQQSALLTLAELVGGMAQVISDTVGHVKFREQFGRPIGSFQAVKHQLADMYVACEQARAAVQFAAIECATSVGTAADSVSAVSRWVPRAAVDVHERAIHLHGAMGYSWETRAHLFLRRALSVRTALSRPRADAASTLSKVASKVAV